MNEKQRAAELMRNAADARWQRWTTEFARSSQIPHESKAVSLFIAGRGSGKTRAGAEWLVHRMCTEIGKYALIGPDYGHLVVEILEPYIYSMIPEAFRHWRGSLHQLDLLNGSSLRLFTAEKPGKVRGINAIGTWIDEPAEMRFGMDAWTNSRLATRIERPKGLPPQTFVTGTPKRVELMIKLFELLAQRPHSYHHSHSTMKDNIDNLSAETVEELISMYEGTTLGLQELDGIMVEDVDGALLTAAKLSKYRADQPSTSATLRVLSIDPGFSSSPTADEVGMIVTQRIGSGNRAIGEVLDDCSTRGTPGSWGTRIVDKCIEHDIDVIVYEGNMTKQWLDETIVAAFTERGVRCPRLEPVHSKKSKWTRAEPVAALAEKGRYRMVGTFGKLESELTSWVPDSGHRSPNRLDAWAQAGRYMLIKNVGNGKVGSKPTRGIGSVA